MKKIKEKKVKYDVTYDNEGNVSDIEIKNDVKLTKKELNYIIQMSEKKYPAILKFHEVSLNKILEQNEDLFEQFSYENSEGEIVINEEGKEYSYEEYYDHTIKTYTKENLEKIKMPSELNIIDERFKKTKKVKK